MAAIRGRPAADHRRRGLILAPRAVAQRLPARRGVGRAPRHRRPPRTGDPARPGVAGDRGRRGRQRPHRLRRAGRAARRAARGRPERALVLPLSALFGAVLLMPRRPGRRGSSASIPVGVVTAVIGAPFFLSSCGAPARVRAVTRRGARGCAASTVAYRGRRGAARRRPRRRAGRASRPRRAERRRQIDAAPGARRARRADGRRVLIAGTPLARPRAGRASRGGSPSCPS